MAGERIEGRNISGQAGEGSIKRAGESAPDIPARLNQAAGAVQDAYGKTVDAAVEGARSVKGAVVAGHDVVAKFMEENPHTTAAIALGLGLLIGYSARRPPPRRWWER
jgi:ElaB/YqjD/DUF883 family membrane-anchored ribosome-binding protein